MQYFEFHAIRVYRQGKGGWVRRGRRRKGMLVCFQESHFLVGIVEFSGHCVLCGSEIELGGGEYRIYILLGSRNYLICLVDKFD